MKFEKKAYCESQGFPGEVGCGLHGDGTEEGIVVVMVCRGE